MIPLDYQDEIRQIFGEALVNPVKLDLFTQRPSPVVIPGRDECRFCVEVGELLGELAAIGGKLLRLNTHELGARRDLEGRWAVERAPTTVYRGVLNRPVRYLGFPAAYQLSAILNLIINCSRGATALPAPAKRRLKRVKRDLPVQVYVVPDDPNGVAAVDLAAALALENGRIHLSIVEIAEFPQIAQQEQIKELPLTVIDGRVRLPSVLGIDELVAEVVRVAETTVATRPGRLAGGGFLLDLPASGGGTTDVETRPSGLIIPRR